MKILEMRIDFNEFYQRKDEEARNANNEDADMNEDENMYGSEDDDDEDDGD